MNQKRLARQMERSKQAIAAMSSRPISRPVAPQPPARTAAVCAPPVAPQQQQVALSPPPAPPPLAVVAVPAPIAEAPSAPKAMNLPLYRPQPTRQPSQQEQDPHIRSLECEIEELQTTIIGFAPSELRHVLYGYYRCKTKSDLSAWEFSTVEAIIDFAKPDRTDRANCPLCGCGTTADWGARDVGWSHPSGLYIHLRGEGRTSQCSVMQAALRKARRELRPQLREAEAAERQAREQRRLIEPVLLVDLSGQPRLFDDGVSFYEKPRDPKGMEFAEQRLASLGFVRHQQENAISYQWLDGDLLVLADPRLADRIVFYGFKIRGRKSKSRQYVSFYLRDDWNRNLKGQFDKRLAAEVGRHGF